MHHQDEIRPIRVGEWPRPEREQELTYLGTHSEHRDRMAATGGRSLKRATAAKARHLSIRGVLALTALLALPHATSHARDWIEVGNVPNGTLSVDTRSLRSDDHQIETRVRVDAIGHSIRTEGFLAGSVVMTEVIDCKAGTSAVIIDRFYSLVGGTGRLLKCKEVHESLEPIGPGEKPLFDFLCSNPAFRNRQAYPNARSPPLYQFEVGPNIGCQFLPGGKMNCSDKAKDARSTQQALAEEERAFAHCP